MNYRKDKYGNPISILGFGCMRFTQSGVKIDLDKAEREILEAIQSGVNYFDTAYVYPGSEDALGRILEKNHLRDQVSIATKLPHYLLRKPGSFEKYFSEELKRLRTDRVDYYLMHMLTDVKTWERLKSLGIVEWLREKQRSGAIRQVGFSYHGNSEMFCQLVDAYDWDFCQIQYNYMDEHSQAGRRGLQYAASKHIPVMIMEPLRGGKLVGLLPDAARQLFAAQSCGVGVPVAVEPAGGHLRAVRHELPGHGPGECENRVRRPGGRADPGRRGTAPERGPGHQPEHQGRLYRVRVLYGLPEAGGYSGNLCGL